MSLQRTFGGQLSWLGSIALLAGAASCGGAPAPEPAPSPVAAPVSVRPLKVEQAAPFTPNVVQLTPDSAAALAKADRAAITPRLAPGLELNLWAAEPMIADPIGITFDDQGRLFATRTRRTGEGEIDIRGHQDWMVPSITFKDVEDKRAFYHNVLAPERSAQNQWLKDWNGDGSRDWRDLAFAKEGLYRIEDTNGDGVADKSTLVLEDFNDLVSDSFHDILWLQGRSVRHGVARPLAPARHERRRRDRHEGIAVARLWGAHRIRRARALGPTHRPGWSHLLEAGRPRRPHHDARGTGALQSEQRRDPAREPRRHQRGDLRHRSAQSAGVRVRRVRQHHQPGQRRRSSRPSWNGSSTSSTAWTAAGASTGSSASTSIRTTTTTRSGWTRGCGSRAGRTGGVLHAAPSRIGTPVPRASPTTRAPRSATRGRATSSLPCSSARRPISTIQAFTVAPQGAGFKLDKDTAVVKGGLSTTGVKFGPDGKLYLADWIEGWEPKGRGRIWTLDVPAAARNSARAEVKSLIAADFKSRSVADLVGLLRPRRHAHSPEGAVRARRSQRGRRAARGRARQTQLQLARIHGIWGLAPARAQGRCVRRVRSSTSSRTATPRFARRQRSCSAICATRRRATRSSRC